MGLLFANSLLNCEKADMKCLTGSRAGVYIFMLGFRAERASDEAQHSRATWSRSAPSEQCVAQIMNAH